ncbi:hypothetical protein EJ05DRAFT_499144 [Pseudovirgaria hyperparasitica]|uniref:Uncharacterized protein n=1 Tax=Pseudovirgaria hyperparasitica TaxID=470096 RepID=A0A6A6WD18_9PEZI|nr:uncharacterized protein EJ05DRAFT_499144 [Pseudovirgaria hyperparasitica]KAF2759954.1 hypothetical protein EJ05DRAFT_499144 [Pseudovirgaria hyperparasitica]
MVVAVRHTWDVLKARNDWKINVRQNRLKRAESNGTDAKVWHAAIEDEDNRMELSLTSSQVRSSIPVVQGGIKL